MKDEFRTQPIQFLPVAGSLAFGVLCGYLALMSNTDVYQVTPFPEGVGSFVNGLYFVILVAVGATLLYLLVKRKRLRLISLVTGFAITVAVFMLSAVYLSAAFSLTAVPDAIALTSTLVAAACITALADFAIFKTEGKISGITILLLGGALGAFLGISIPPLSAVLILTFLAAYDIFAVYRGPVGKIAHSGLEQLRGLSFSFRDVQMGLGDLTFYSMLTGLVLAVGGPAYCAASVAGVLLGVLLVFKMLEKRHMFPGLPFPVLFGLLPLIVSFFL